MKRFLWPILYGLLLTAFTVWLALDTFVIERVIMQSPLDAGQQSAPEKPVPDSSPVMTDTTYRDANISITLTEYRERNTSVYVADVTLASPSLLQTALARGAYGRNVTERTSAMAQTAGAILAVNGDYYGARERGYVVRDGVVYRSSADRNRDALAIMDDGSFRIVAEGTTSAEELVAQGAVHVLSFGPGLLVDGEIAVDENDEVGQSMASNPRTAIGVIEPDHYILLVSDGRTQQSQGLSLLELAEFMKTLGVVTAYNLDGGGSSTMVFGGRIINNPTTNGRSIRERSVSDIVYIGY